MELYHPVKPLGINQAFGVNPTYYAKFGWKGHNGIDFFAPHATPLYAPCDGYAFYVTDAHGGDGIYIRTPQDEDGVTYDIILWHLCSKDDPKYKPLIPINGSSVPVKLGDLIGYTDNSGAPYESSGDHLHFGLMPLNKFETAADPQNGFGGCIDPQPFFNGKFAQDIVLETQIVEKSSQIVTLVGNATDAQISHEDKISLLEKVEAFLQSLL